MKKALLFIITLLTLNLYSQDCSTLIVESVSKDANCNGGFGKIDLTKVQGGSGHDTYDFKWTEEGSDSIICTSQNLKGEYPLYENLYKAGIYTVTVTDTNGCIVTITDTINEPTKINIESSIISDDDEASIESIVTGGSSPYTYEYIELKEGKKNKDPEPKFINDLEDLKTGYYRVRVTDSVGCTMETSPDDGWINGWIEIKDVHVADRTYLMVYPNPANIYTIIEYKVDSRREYNIIITKDDLSNQVLYSEVLNPNENKLELMVNDYEPGYYFITIRDDRRLREYKKIKVTH